MTTVRRLEFAHPGTIIEAAAFVQSRLLTLSCEAHQSLAYYQVPTGLPGRYHVTVETCCLPAIARAAEALNVEGDAAIAATAVARRVGGPGK